MCCVIIISTTISVSICASSGWAQLDILTASLSPPFRDAEPTDDAALAVADAAATEPQQHVVEYVTWRTAAAAGGSEPTDAAATEPDVTADGAAATDARTADARTAATEPDVSADDAAATDARTADARTAATTDVWTAATTDVWTAATTDYAAATDADRSVPHPTKSGRPFVKQLSLHGSRMEVHVSHRHP